MRYVLTNTDGSVEIVGCRPIALTRLSDGVTIRILGSRRRGDRRILYGTDGFNGVEIDIGPGDTDPADMEENSLSGFICHFSTVEREKAKRHPVNAAKIMGGRKLDRQELIDSGIGSVNARGRIVHDHTYREAWKDGGKLGHDMDKCRVIHMARIRAARNAKLDETDKLVAALDGGPIPVDLRALRQMLRDVPQTTDLSKATDVASLKVIWPEALK